MVLIGGVFFATLAQFRKTDPRQAEASVSPVDLLLNELKQEDAASQLDGVSHLGDIDDPRIVPALSNLLTTTKSEQVIESIAEALGKKKDPQAAAALKTALKNDYGPFLKLTFAKALIDVNDPVGYAALIDLLKNDDGVLNPGHRNDQGKGRPGLRL